MLLTVQLWMTDARHDSDIDLSRKRMAGLSFCIDFPLVSDAIVITMACMSNMTLVEWGVRMAEVVAERDRCREEAEEVLTFSKCGEEGGIVAVGILLLQAVAVVVKQGEWGRVGRGEGVITTRHTDTLTCLLTDMLTHRHSDILTYSTGWTLLAPRLRGRRAAKLAQPVQLMVRQVGSWALVAEWLEDQAVRTLDRAEATVFRVSE